MRMDRHMNIAADETPPAMAHRMNYGENQQFNLASVNQKLIESNKSIRFGSSHGQNNKRKFIKNG